MDKEEENRRRIQLIGTFVMTPFILAVPPIVGWFIWTWLDKQFGTAPFMMYLLIVSGFAAGGREFYRILKKYGNQA